jgi:phenolic acid decarboxylase
MKFEKEDLSGLSEKHLVYTYDNGWNHEIYVKNETIMDYRIHCGIVGNRWVKDQKVYMVQVADQV